MARLQVALPKQFLEAYRKLLLFPELRPARKEPKFAVPAQSAGLFHDTATRETGKISLQIIDGRPHPAHTNVREVRYRRRTRIQISHPGRHEFLRRPAPECAGGGLLYRRQTALLPGEHGEGSR